MRRAFGWVIAALGGALVLQSANVAKATITVHDLSEDTTTGTFSYTIQLDDAADVNVGDGFVLYDFPGFASYSITGGLTSSQFSLVQSSFSNIVTQSGSVDANANVAAISNGLPFDSATPNLSFVYVGPPMPDLGPTTAILTIDSTVTGGLDNSVYASVDHSGPTSAHPFSFSANPILVPASVPEPASIALAAVSAFGLLGRRRRNA